MASATPVTVLVAPGPLVTRHTPTSPLTRAEAFSGVGGGLFVTHENVVEAVAVVIECIIHRHDGASGITEKRFHPLRQRASASIFLLPLWEFLIVDYLLV